MLSATPHARMENAHASRTINDQYILKRLIGFCMKTTILALIWASGLAKKIESRLPKKGAAVGTWYIAAGDDHCRVSRVFANTVIQ